MGKCWNIHINLMWCRLLFIWVSKRWLPWAKIKALWWFCRRIAPPVKPEQEEPLQLVCIKEGKTGDRLTSLRCLNRLQILRGEGKISWLPSALLQRCTAVAYRMHFHGHAQDHTPGENQSEQQNQGQRHPNITFLCTIIPLIQDKKKTLKVPVYCFIYLSLNAPRLDISMKFDGIYFDFPLYQWEGLVMLQPTSRGQISVTVWGNAASASMPILLAGVLMEPKLASFCCYIANQPFVAAAAPLCSCLDVLALNWSFFSLIKRWSARKQEQSEK